MVGLAWTGLGCGSEASDEETSVEVARADLRSFPASIGFTDVRDMVSDGENLWVLDRAAPFITRVSLDGADVQRFGNQGEGPSELGRPVALRVTLGHVDVWDVGLGKRASFFLDGTLDAVHRLSDERSGWIRADIERVSHVDPWRVRARGDITYFVRLPYGMTQPLDFGRGELVRASVDLEPDGSVVRFEDYLPRDERGVGQFPAVPLWDVCPSGMAIWNPRDGRVEWIDERGVLIHSVRVASPGVRITDEGILTFLRAMADHELGSGVEVPAEVFRARLREVRPVFGQLATDFVDLRCALDAAVWLRHFDLEADPLGADDTWLRVPTDGEALRVRFPSNFEPFLFAAEEIVGVVQTPDGDRLGSWRASPFLPHVPPTECPSCESDSSSPS